MIVAGFGFRKGATGADIVAALDAALIASALDRTAVARLATSDSKAGEHGIVEAGRLLSLPLVAVNKFSLEISQNRTLTRSARSLEATGTPSLCEASALAAAGRDSVLLGPRVATAVATCALARSAP